ncbi:uncharacterized protein C8R40DRAFT_1176275 [Lentinula edodes]|uniref:uncharacterized protein n=1 Tax=Lentinula edodes TaxID=5353 RepID=UPI001E8D244A|nr:uncharacterized protein C8R40DRAFT_1176275 [Lentinula edodes]KAH7869940.1 hypothetical protein C8R40DRAFT_1176275 [Lentinula edodes]
MYQSCRRCGEEGASTGKTTTKIQEPNLSSAPKNELTRIRRELGENHCASSGAVSSTGKYEEMLSQELFSARPINHSYASHRTASFYSPTISHYVSLSPRPNLSKLSHGLTNIAPVERSVSIVDVDVFAVVWVPVASVVSEGGALPPPPSIINSSTLANPNSSSLSPNPQPHLHPTTTTILLLTANPRGPEQTKHISVRDVRLLIAVPLD